MRSLRLMTALLLVSGIAIGRASATMDAIHAPANARADRANPEVTPTTATDRNADVAAAEAMLKDATSVIRTMAADPAMANLMQHAKGIFVVPEYGRAALILGIGGGGGVMLTNNNGHWSAPLFLNAGGGSFGLQAGASGGPAAFLIMNQQVMDKFASGNGWSVNAAAGVNVANYSVSSQMSPGKDNDVIVWSAPKGLYLGAGVGLTGITNNSAYNNAIYGSADVNKILALRTPKNQLASGLRAELSTGLAMTDGARRTNGSG